MNRTPTVAECEQIVYGADRAELEAITRQHARNQNAEARGMANGILAGAVCIALIVWLVAS